MKGLHMLRVTVTRLQRVGREEPSQFVPLSRATNCAMLELEITRSSHGTRLVLETSAEEAQQRSLVRRTI